MSIRRAQPKDISDLVENHIVGFANDASATYRYPYRDQFPEDYPSSVRERYLETIKSNDTIFVVYEVAKPSFEDSDTTSDTPPSLVVGHAIWGLPGYQYSSSKPMTADSLDEAATNSSTLIESSAIPRRQKDRHISVPHDTLFRNNLRENQKLFFDDVYGTTHLYLRTLVVNPAYQRQGIGEALVRWGMDKAKADGFRACTLFSAEAGTKLYTKVGFVEIGRFVTRLEGEDNGIVMPGMRWEVQ